MNILNPSAMKDSAWRTSPRSFSSHAYLPHNCHTAACPSLATTNLPRAQGVNHFLRGELEGA